MLNRSRLPFERSGSIVGGKATRGMATRSTSATRSTHFEPAAHGLGGPRLRLRVLLHRQGIERELAKGGEVEAAPEFRLRSCQITGNAERRRLASCLWKLITEAEAVPRRFPFSPVVPIQREAVLIWRDSIIAIAGRLERPMPVGAAGIARLRLLLTDGAGPLFDPTSDYLMADVLPRIEEDLDPDQGARR
jgi:hypothetical protein